MSSKDNNADEKRETNADNTSARIEEIEKDINKQFGAGAIYTQTNKIMDRNSESISTGSIALDDAVGNEGILKGRIVEIYGPESSGKTTACLHMIMEVQKKGGVAAIIDVEHALDPKYIDRLGIDRKKLLISQPNSGEEALSILETLAQKKVDLVILDSVAALVTKAEIEGDMGDAHIGLQARLMSQALKKIAGIISKSGTIVVFTNQLRSKIGVMYGNPETTCGGSALKFYASIRIDIRRIEFVKKGDEIVGIKVRAKVVKNKCGAPFKEAVITIMYNKGFHIANEIIDFGVQFNLIQKSGAWYSMGSTKIGQGIDAVSDYFKKYPQVMEEVKNKVYKILEEKNKNTFVPTNENTVVEPSSLP